MRVTGIAEARLIESPALGNFTARPINDPFRFTWWSFSMSKNVIFGHPLRLLADRHFCVIALMWERAKSLGFLRDCHLFGGLKWTCQVDFLSLVTGLRLMAVRSEPVASSFWLWLAARLFIRSASKWSKGTGGCIYIWLSNACYVAFLRIDIFNQINGPVLLAAMIERLSISCGSEIGVCRIDPTTWDTWEGPKSIIQLFFVSSGSRSLASSRQVADQLRSSDWAGTYLRHQTTSKTRDLRELLPIRRLFNEA